MTNAGTLMFGVWDGSTETISSASSYNDGSWHHVVATQDGSGMALYVDGAPVGTDPATGHVPYWGNWHIGSGNLSGWPSEPSSTAFSGWLDEVAVYDYALTQAQVTAHYTAPDYPQAVSDDGPVSY